MSHPTNCLHRTLAAAAAAAAALAFSATALAGPIEDLSAGQWLEIPNSKIRSVLPSPLPSGDPANIINAWSGGAFDTQRNRLLVWGGGHNDYCGNEVYAFEVATLKWTRLTDPGGEPVAVHSYDGLEYLPVQDQFFAAGGSTCSPGGNATNGTWTLHLDTNTWEERPGMPGVYGDFWELSMLSDYDPVSARVIMIGAHDTADFDPVANRWRTHGNDLPGLDLNTTGAFDPVKRKFVSIGSNTAYIFSVDATGKAGARANLNSTGAKDLEGTIAPGLTYDAVSRKLVGWNGGSSVYTLDADTRVWTKFAATNSVTPGNPFASGQYRGTLGRFRYMPALNAFIVVTHIDANVFVYKLSTGPGIVDPTVSLSANPTTVAAQGMAALTWSSSNANACTAGNGWSGTKALSGTQDVGPIAADTTYSLTCTNTGGGSTTKSVTVRIQAASPLPTVSFAADRTVVPSGERVTLTWSTNASGCTASGAWAGNKASSGTEQSAALLSNSTFSLACSNSAGSTARDVSVTVTSGATIPPPSSGGSSKGGGALGLWTLGALAALAAGRRRLRPRTGTAVAVGAALCLVPLHALALTPEEDWIARSTAPGVVRAMGFETQTEYQEGLWNQGRHNAWDQTVKASGNGSLRFDIKSNTGEGAGGSWTMNFSKDLSVQFGANEEFWVQWRQRFDAFVIQHSYAHLSGSGEWKQLDIAQGDMPGVIANSCSEAELVMQNVSNRDYPSAYLECGNYYALEELVGSNQSRQNQRRTAGGASTCQWVPPGDTSGCLRYFPDEWMTFMIHVQLGPEGTARSSIGDATQRRGFINSTIEFYVGRAGQPLQLAHRQGGIVIPRGEHWNSSTGINPDNPGDPGYSGGWGPSDGHPNARYGKLWLLPYNTQKDPAETHQDASIWYDEVIVSRQRIADPMTGGSTGGPPPPAAPTAQLSANPTSVTAGSRTTLTWSSSNATGCTAGGSWAGNKASSGSEQSAALFQTSTFGLDCTGAGGTASKSVVVSVTAAGTEPPPSDSGGGGKGALGWVALGGLLLARGMGRSTAVS